MSFSIGIVGLPNAGKSTLFKALTKKEIDIASYPFTTIDPNVGIVKVPDERLDKISEIIKPEKTTLTAIKFVDIAGLVKNAHKGEGLGNQFLSHVAECDAILEIVRNFSSSNNNSAASSEETEYEISEKPNPKRDIDIIKNEMIMKDLQTTRNNLQKLEKKFDSSDKKLKQKYKTLKKIEKSLSKDKKIIEINLKQEEVEAIKEFQFLTQKPTVYIFNFSESQNNVSANIKNDLPSNTPILKYDIKTEQEVSELSEQDKKELEMKSNLDSLIIACYNILNLITFYTIAGFKETRAWTLKKGKTCPEAGGVVHSDFQDNFIKAQVIFWEDLIKAGGWKTAKEKGLIRTEGKNYIVKDGDITEFKV